MQGFCMKEYIEERAIEIAYYIIEHKATVRQTASDGLTVRSLSVTSLCIVLLLTPNCLAVWRRVKNIFISTNCQRQHLRQCKHSGCD